MEPFSPNVDNRTAQLAPGVIRELQLRGFGITGISITDVRLVMTVSWAQMETRQLPYLRNAAPGDARMESPFRICQKIGCVTRDVLQRLKDENRVATLPDGNGGYLYKTDEVQDIVNRFRKRQLQGADPEPFDRYFHDPHKIRSGELARIVGVSVATIHSWAGQGLITATRTRGGQWRYDIRSVREFIRTQTYEGRARKRRRCRTNTVE